MYVGFFVKNMLTSVRMSQMIFVTTAPLHLNINITKVIDK